MGFLSGYFRLVMVFTVSFMVIRFGQGVITALVPGVTLAQAAQCQPATTPDTVLCYGLPRVVGAAGIETAMLAQKGAHQGLVAADQENQ